MTRMDADAGRGGGQRRPGVRGRGRRASEGGERASEARRARPRAGRAPRARVARLARRAGKALQTPRADGGFPPARCFVGSAAEGKKRPRRIPPSTPLASTRARRRDRGEDPSRSRPGSRPSRRRPARRTRADAARAPRRRIIARQKSPGRLTWVRGREYGKASGARARARTSRRAPTRSARIRSPSARVVVSPRRALTGRCAFVVRLERADESGARARDAGRSVRESASVPVTRSRAFPLAGVTNPRCQCARFPGSRNRQSRDPTSSRDGWGRSPPVRHGSKTQIDRSPLRFQATVTSGFSRDPLERFDSPDRTRDRPLRSDGSTIRRFTHRGFFRPARDRPRIAKPNPRSGAPRSRVGTKSTERS